MTGGSAGFLISSPVTAFSAIAAAAIPSDGRVLLAGWPFDPFSADLLNPFGYDRPRLLRLDAAGGLDAGFGGTGDGVASLNASGRAIPYPHTGRLH